MAKKHLVGIILGTFMSLNGWSQTTGPSVIATPPQPTWSELTVAQKIVLCTVKRRMGLP